MSSSSLAPGLPLPELVTLLGESLVEVVVAGTGREVDDVTLLEADDSVGAPGDLLLAVGVGSPERAVAVLGAAGPAGVAAVALRRRLAEDARVRRAAERAGPGLLAVAEEASWAHLAWLTREVLDRAGPTRAGEPAAVELSALADACADLLGGSVTIEDVHSRVLAYSARHELTDPIRVSTIVGRRVPAEIVASLRARGVFRHLLRSTEPIFVPAAGPLGPRLVVPVHSGGELIGSIWAVVGAAVEPPVLRALQDVAAVVALHLLRLRSEADLSRRILGEQLRAALAGDTAAADAQLPAPPWRVAVLGVDPGASRDAALAYWLSVFRRGAWHRPRLVPTEQDLVVVLTERVGRPEPGSWPWLAELMPRLPQPAPWAWAMAGQTVDTAAGLPDGLATARELARLRAAQVVTEAALTCGQAWAAITVDRAVRALAAHPDGGVGPVALTDPDLLGTLGAWLDHPGDLRACAQRLHVHPNTVRYRIAKLTRLLDVDLAEPTVRLALALQVRVAQARAANP